MHTACLHPLPKPPQLGLVGTPGPFIISRGNTLRYQTGSGQQHPPCVNPYLLHAFGSDGCRCGSGGWNTYLHQRAPFLHPVIKLPIKTGRKGLLYPSLKVCSRSLLNVHWDTDISDLYIISNGHTFPMQPKSMALSRGLFSKTPSSTTLGTVITEEALVVVPNT